jgi:dihydroorotate dehydrogenase electron transfer subunit
MLASLPMIQASATIIARQASGSHQELLLRAPELASQLSAGQAILIKAGPGFDPYLRRTFHPVTISSDTFSIRLPPSADWAHAWLRAAPEGSEIDCLGPVGNGFELEASVRNLLCVGQGEPGWSLLPLIGWAAAAGLAVTFAAGAATLRDSVPAARLPAAVEYHLVTGDGRQDATGALLSTLSDLLPWADAVCAAGSLDFYARLAETIRGARYGVTRSFSQVLYPSAFLCGMGACQSCAADVAGGRRRVCLRGPVFDLADVIGAT